MLEGLTPASLVGGLVPFVVAALTLLVFRWRRRDEVFVNLTPGEVPGLGEAGESVRVRRGVEYSGAVAPRFHQPEHSTPALSGTVIDGVVHGRDLAATLVDLALRGHVLLAREGKDWRVTRADVTGDPLAPHEVALLDAVLGGATSVLLGDLRRAEVVARWRAAEISVYRAVVDRGWYTRHPRSRNGRLAALGVLLVVASAVAGVVSGLAEDHLRWAPLGVGLGLGGALLLWRGRGRTPRTATGSAARIQALGYERYLATAEAGQLRHEELAGEVRAMLPYAVAFGVAGHVAAVLGDALRAAQVAAGAQAALDIAVDAAIDPGVWDLVSGLVDLADLDVSGLGDLVPEDAFEALVEGVEGLGDALGHLAGAVGGILPTDGCGDGCGEGCLDF